MVNGNQSLELLAGFFIKDILNKDIASISVKVQKSQVKNCYFMYLINWKQVWWEVFNWANTFNELLKRAWLIVWNGTSKEGNFPRVRVLGWHRGWGIVWGKAAKHFHWFGSLCLCILIRRFWHQAGSFQRNQARNKISILFWGDLIQIHWLAWQLRMRDFDESG